MNISHLIYLLESDQSLNMILRTNICIQSTTQLAKVKNFELCSHVGNVTTMRRYIRRDKKRGIEVDHHAFLDHNPMKIVN